MQDHINQYQKFLVDKLEFKIDEKNHELMRKKLK